ncbi:peptidase S8/S53 domain-containing protein [Mucor mucedo]|uniref:peptidase S8/S53 domain-containing protein n=1 Tax=Mucor mucedo TaxID=29922 RepID=UPI00221F218B|nr:peptidase S8/S53 domain-containing protein [Mucor mucedo]KAI7871369.1 peptidase S8/S53 domain-containing protein [Mucor mucedo]
MVAKTFILFAISCVTAVASASDIFSTLDTTLKQGNGNFIIQLSDATCIKDFVPKFIDNALDVYTQAAGAGQVAKRNNNKIVRRDTDAEQVHVFDAYDFGSQFKAITVKFEDLDLVKALLETFDTEIIKIIPDMDIKFDLPTLAVRGSNKYHAKRATAQRAGNFHFDSYKHDANCPHAHDDEEIVEKRAVSVPSNATASATYVSQTGAQWNLARISERSLDLTKPYIYDSTAGSAAYVYIVDDGLNTAHNEFEGRATWGFSAYTGQTKLGTGHGTHVGGIVGGKTYGVAKKTNLIGVKVLDDTGSGAISAILAGLQFVTNDAKKHVGKNIINMSLGLDTNGATNPTYDSFNTAITAVVNGGIPLIAAAGNAGLTTCQALPAGNPNVYAVAATDKTDTQASYSNWGSCTQIYAPGSSILSSYISGVSSTATLSGTSMASPHVAGVAALLINSLSNPSPAQVYAKLSSLGTTGKVKSVSSGTPNVLLFNGQTQTTN